MAIKIQKPHETVKARGIKALIYGESGVGKTVLSTTTNEPTVIISAEGGLMSIQNAPDYVDVIEVASIGDVQEAYSHLLAGTDYKWVVLDSLSEIGEKVLTYEKANTKDGRMAYGALNDQMQEFIRAFRDLPGYHVVMMAKEHSYETAEGPKIGPSMPGSKLGQGLPYFFDLVLPLRIQRNLETGEDVRYLQTRLDQGRVAKDRSGFLDLHEEPNLRKIAAKILGTSQSKAA